MIKKLITIIFGLLVLAVLGLAVLIFWVNPNHYKGLITQAVKEKTGYELTISGDLHWHVWPKVSLLSEGVSLKDPALKVPLLVADNMRFDVELFPLFSKKLVITDVFIKAATVTLTDDSSRPTEKIESSVPAVSAPTSGKETEFDSVLDKMAWLSDLNKLQIVDSVVAYQSQQGLINLRKINLLVTQKTKGLFSVDFAGQVNRNRSDFEYHLVTDLDMRSYPTSASLSVKQVDYRIQGADMPANGIYGQFSGELVYDPAAQKMTAPDLKLRINDNLLVGSVSAVFASHPHYTLALSADTFSVVPFLSTATKTANSSSSSGGGVVVNGATKNSLAFLRDFDADMSLKAKTFKTNTITLSNMTADAQNRQGLLSIKQAKAQFAGGQVALSGNADGRQEKEHINVSVEMKNINSDKMFDELKIEKNVSGILGLQGKFTTNSLTAPDLFSQLNGNMTLHFDRVRFNNINLEGLIQSASLLTNKESLDKNTVKRYTEFHKMTGQATLSGGLLKFSTLQADSDTLNVKGNGWLNTKNSTVDVNLTAKILSGWNNKSDTIRQLQNVAIPVRVYGSVNQLHYDLNLNELLKQRVEDKLSEKVNKEIDRVLNKIDKKGSEDHSRQETREKLKDGIKGLLDKLK